MRCRGPHVLLLLPVIRARLVAARSQSADFFDVSNRPFKVLLTGFGPFLNFSSNPTTDIARKLDGTCDVIDILPLPGERKAPKLEGTGGGPSTRLTVCWHTKVLPVNRTGAEWTSRHLQSLGQHQPYHAVLHTGLEDKAKGLKLEVAAANLQAQDNGTAGRTPAAEGEQDLLPTTVNVGWLSLKNLVITGDLPRGRRSSEIELWSRDPGAYYCNEVYFRTLHFVRSTPLLASTGALLPALFVHVQNPEASSVLEDVDSVRQIAAHALWATYVAPYPEPPPIATLTEAWGMALPPMDVLCFAMCSIWVLAICMLPVAGRWRARGARSGAGSRSALNAPLQQWEHS